MIRPPRRPAGSVLLFLVALLLACSDPIGPPVRPLPSVPVPVPVPVPAPPPPRPAPPPYPAERFDLPVPRWRPAVVAAPRLPSAPPHRLILVLHGNFDRPEWECETWEAAARPHGWILCPRGLPRTDVERGLDRWTYAGPLPATQELEAGVAVLEARFPGAVRRDDAWLVGFSLGAIYAAAVVRTSTLSFSALILVEGGTDVSDWLARTLAGKGIRAVAYLCGEVTGCAGRARSAVRAWTRAGVAAQVFVMPRTGHGYSEDFDPLGREVIAFVSERRSGPAPAAR